MALWARVAPDVDVEAWSARAVGRGVAFRGGRFYDFDGATLQATRLGFTPLDERELDEAVKRMAEALPPARPSQERRRGSHAHPTLPSPVGEAP